LKKKREYDIKAKNKCKLLGWRTDLMSTYIVAKNYSGHEKGEQDLVYKPISSRKTIPVRIV